MRTIGNRQETIEVDVTPLNFLIDLFKHEFMGYDIYNDFKIEDDKLYVYIDSAYHGSSMLEPRLVAEGENKIRKFNHIKELINLYK